MVSSNKKDHIDFDDCKGRIKLKLILKLNLVLYSFEY